MRPEKAWNQQNPKGAERPNPLHLAKTKSRRGFAAMSIEKRISIARKGGIEAHRKGSAHEWTSEEARIAGRKGGQATRKN